MKILVLTFYFEPDLCAGSFRVTSFLKSLQSKLSAADQIDVITTMPNRYHSYNNEVTAYEFEKKRNMDIYRIQLPLHNSGFIDQVKSFNRYFFRALSISKNKEYDLVFATSSRLFTAFLGAIVAKKKKVSLYLDIRDLFTDTMNSLLSKKIKFIVSPIFYLIEKFTFNRATKINIVSGGFEEYINKIVPSTPLSVYMNGIDEEFLNINFCENSRFSQNHKQIILYAGNIGLGQGLDKIIPEILENLDKNIEFWVVGDGGTKSLLVSKTNGMENVKFFNPVNRKELIEFYKKADFLFLHLNDVEAFKRVLPSKIFEYSVTKKPLIAGVKGFAKEFIKQNIENSIVFNSGDAKDFHIKFREYNYHFSSQNDLVVKYRRKNIMEKMCDDLLSLIK